jgi:hypothetical protein
MAAILCAQRNDKRTDLPDFDTGYSVYPSNLLTKSRRRLSCFSNLDEKALALRADCDDLARHYRVRRGSHLVRALGSSQCDMSVQRR